MSTFLRTLGIILQAAAPSSSALGQMTSELWSLLFALSESTEDLVMESIMFDLLIILDSNQKEALASREMTPLMQTLALASNTLDATYTKEKTKLLASAVLIKVQELINGNWKGELLQ